LLSAHPQGQQNQTGYQASHHLLSLGSVATVAEVYRRICRMSEQRLRWWPIAKMLLGVAIVALVGWQLASDLRKLPPRSEPIGYGWLVASAVFYLMGLGLSGVFWLRLLGHFGAGPPWLKGIRGYFLSQLGKYAPGKALALVMRVGFVHGPHTPRALAALAAFYEVLTTMAVGALVALLLIPIVLPAEAAGIDWGSLYDPAAHHDPTAGQIALLALCLFLITALPLTPWLFNRMSRGVTRPFGMATPPPVSYRYLGEGVLLIAPCWLLFGLALACGLAAVPEVNVPWTFTHLGRITVCIAVAYVGGFVVPTPGGLGGREFLLLMLLIPILEGDRPTATLAVLLVRLAWTVGELVLAGCLYLVPPTRGAT
jgi:uncharacterized membrane protein YbhN (UPF0104 family)